MVKTNVFSSSVALFKSAPTFHAALLCIAIVYLFSLKCDCKVHSIAAFPTLRPAPLYLKAKGGGEKD